MGIDKSLSDKYPSVVINGRNYQYGREPNYGQYLVENASYAKDYWVFNKKEDLEAFLINLPESANHQARITAAYPDWHDVSDEQRTAYLEEDRASQRALADEKRKVGTAQSFDMDLEGEHGPHEPQRIESRSKQPPIERVERQIADYKAAEAVNAKRAGYPVEHGQWPRGYTEALKLRVLEGEIDWNGVTAEEKEAVLAREVNFAAIKPDQFAFVYEDIAFEGMEPGHPAVAQALFERSRTNSGTPSVRDTTRNLVDSILLDAWPRSGAIVDFGLKSQEHYESLYYPVREGEITAEQLDAALGNGKKLTALARSARSNPHRDIEFSTDWDDLLEEPEDLTDAPGRDVPETDAGGGLEFAPMTEAEDRQRADRIDEFQAAIEEHRQKNDGAEWAAMSEEEKLETMYFESCTVLHGLTVPGPALLEAIEQNVDYSSLPPTQRGMLSDLRHRLDAGEMDSTEQGRHDPVATAIGAIVDTAYFERSLSQAKEDTTRPWAEISDDDKVYEIIAMARDSGAWVSWGWDGNTPGAHVLATIEHEVDYENLAPWRREGLESIRARISRGALDDDWAAGEDRVTYELRMAELESVIQDDKRDGITVKRRTRVPWDDLTEDEKLGRIEHLIDVFSVEGQPKPVDVIAREVDLAGVSQPTKARMETVLGQIRDVVSADYVQRRGEEYTEKLFPWLEPTEKIALLEKHVDWQGLDGPQKQSVIQRVLDDGKPESWMDGIGTAALKGVPCSARAADNQEPTKEIFENVKTYQVWHDRGWPQNILDQTLGGAPPSKFPQDYFHVADVLANGLNEAVELTTSKGHILRDDHHPWDGHPHVRSYAPGPFAPRDTSVGDVIVDPEGIAHRYDGKGFHPADSRTTANGFTADPAQRARFQPKDVDPAR